MKISKRTEPGDEWGGEKTIYSLHVSGTGAIVALLVTFGLGIVLGTWL